MNTLSILRGSNTQKAKPSLWARFVQARAIAKERALLRTLSRARLDDIGVTRTQADIEANRAAWDVPSHWKR